MTSHLTIDQNTHVAFVDISEAADNAQIRVVTVSEQFGLKSQIMARIDTENNVVLGLIIEDYPAFRREIMMKYVAFRVGKIVELILCSLKASMANERADRRHRLATAV